MYVAISVSEEGFKTFGSAKRSSWHILSRNANPKITININMYL